MADGLTDFDERSFTHDGATNRVFCSGTGPAVIVIHEMPGITPPVVDFARRVRDAGFSVRMPSLFGEPGRPMSTGYVLQSMRQGCVAKEFVTLALDRTSPAISWLRALAADAHAECGGPGVGAVGMCFTGGFALGMMIDDIMLAPVLSQPSLPFPVSPARRRAVGVSNADLARVKARAQNGACLLGLRFTKDVAVPGERFETLRHELGDAFIAIEIDSSKGNRHGIARGAHSVLTEHFVDEPGHPTREALDRVLAFFADRLR
jgi:dienelactone hydrolase